MSDILVTGVTGGTGGATATSLAAGGTRFRAMTRRDGVEMSAGAEPVVADFDDADSLRRALDGVRAVFLVTPSTEHAESQQIRFLDIAEAAGVEHVVLLSQLASRSDSPVRFLRYHAAVEERLRASTLGVTILRPNLFMQGLLVFRSQILSSGVISAPIGDAPVSIIDVDDIGEVAANTLLSPQPHGTLTLTGPEALTHADMAHALGRASRRPIRFISAESEDVAAALTGLMPPWQIEGLVEDYAHYDRGEAGVVTGDVEEMLGRAPSRFEDFAARVAPLLR